jgi:hypothetical protein
MGRAGMGSTYGEKRIAYQASENVKTVKHFVDAGIVCGIILKYVLKVPFYEVIYTMCHDCKSTLLLPTLTHCSNTDTLYFSLICFGAPSSGTIGLMRHTVVGFMPCLEFSTL